jgi:hypothetical protein
MKGFGFCCVHNSDPEQLFKVGSPSTAIIRDIEQFQLNETVRVNKWLSEDFSLHQNFT